MADIVDERKIEFEYLVSDTFSVLTNDEYVRIIRDLDAAKKKSQTKSKREYRLLQRYEVYRVGRVRRLIKKGSSQAPKYFVPFGEVYGVIKNAHLCCGHGGEKKTLRQVVSQDICNVTREQVRRFIAVCNVCQTKRLSPAVRIDVTQGSPQAAILPSPPVQPLRRIAKASPTATVTSSAIKRPRYDDSTDFVQKMPVDSLSSSQPRINTMQPASSHLNSNQRPVHKTRLPQVRTISDRKDEIHPDRSFHNPDHCSHIMSEMSALWKYGKFVDADILVGGSKLQAHRMVLFASSPYLRSCFDNLDPNTQLRLKMPSDIKLDIVFQFLTYLYDGVLKLNTGNVQSLLKVSLMLHIEHMTTCCREYIRQAVKDDRMLPQSQIHPDRPQVVLVDHRPPDLGTSKVDTCTQTVVHGQSEQAPEEPRVYFERVFKGDYPVADQNVKSDMDLFKSYEDSHGSRDSIQCQTDNLDATPDNELFPVKDEPLDPGYEISINLQHSVFETKPDVPQPNNDTVPHEFETSMIDNPLGVTSLLDDPGEGNETGADRRSSQHSRDSHSDVADSQSMFPRNCCQPANNKNDVSQQPSPSNGSSDETEDLSQSPPVAMSCGQTESSKVVESRSNDFGIIQTMSKTQSDDDPA